MCRRTEEVDLWSGSNAIDILYGSVMCPSKHQHGATILRVILRNQTPSIELWDSANNQKMILGP